MIYYYKTNINMSSTTEQTVIDTESKMDNVNMSSLPTEQTVVDTESKMDNTEAKSQKKVISRLFRKTEENGDKKRIVTIKYSFDTETKQLTYAGTIFKTNKRSHEKYVKQNHAKTVEKRFNKSPVVIDNFDYTDKGPEFHDSIRKLLFKNGCKAGFVPKNNENVVA